MINNNIITLPGKIRAEQVEGLPINYSRQYLTIVSLEDNNTITFKLSSNGTQSFIRTISVSTDNGENWTSYTSSKDGVILGTLNTGEKLLLKGNNVRYGESAATYNFFESTGTFNLEGNIMSMLWGDNFMWQTTLYTSSFMLLFKTSNVVSAKNLILPAMTLTDGCYGYMFKDCTSLVEGPELPATTLAQNCYRYIFSGCSSLIKAPELPATTAVIRCYQYMFYNCSSLKEAPYLPATTLDTECYQYMFYGCTRLIKAPTLPATILATGCYKSMFSNCSSLAEAPDLPATTLVESCYSGMFYACGLLKYIKCLATDISATSCLTNWVTYVNKTGVFIKNDSMNNWTISNNGLPANFTVYKESEYNLAHIYDIDNKLYLPSDYAPSGSDYGCGDYYPLLNDSLYNAISKLHKCILDVEYLYNNLDQRLSMIEVTATPTQTDSQGYEEISNTTTATPTSNEVDEYGNTPTPTQIPGFEEGCYCSS